MVSIVFWTQFNLYSSDFHQYFEACIGRPQNVSTRGLYTGYLGKEHMYNWWLLFLGGVGGFEGLVCWPEIFEEDNLGS
jgi:hypothetical protein